MPDSTPDPGIDNPNEATFFKEEIEQILDARYSSLTVYQVIGALEVVKLNLLERLRKSNQRDLDEKNGG